MKDLCFGHALDLLKDGEAVTRENWYGSAARPVVKLQTPDENSKMSLPYLYMEKFVPDNTLVLGNHKVVRFPLDLSCESLLAEDWMLVK